MEARMGEARRSIAARRLCVSRNSCFLTYLTCSVDDFCRKVLSFVFDNSAERILHCGIITIDKVAIDKSDRQR